MHAVEPGFFAPDGRDAHGVGDGLPGRAAAQSIALTRDELTRDRDAEPPPRPTLNVVGGIERSPCPLADPRYADVRVTLTEVRFNNLKDATPQELRSSWAAFANTSQPVAVLCEVRDAAATILRKKGYLAAVQTPTQRIDLASLLLGGVHHPWRRRQAVGMGGGAARRGGVELGARGPALAALPCRAPGA